MNVRRMASWVAHGVPGIYRAAREAGLDRRDAVQVLTASAAALALARKRHPRRWRAENAVRHFVWQAWLTAKYGRPVAEAVGRAHEQMSRDGVDSSVDRGNNVLGQAYGETRAEEIRSSAMRPALSALADEAGRLWDSGQLIASTGSGGGT